MEGKEQTFETAETDHGPESSLPGDLEEDSSSEGSADGYDELNDLDCFGIEAIDRACMLLYPDQPNPIQAEAVMKYWYVFRITKANSLLRNVSLTCQTSSRAVLRQFLLFCF